LWTMGRRRRIERIFPDGIGSARVEHHVTVQCRYITTTLHLWISTFHLSHLYLRFTLDHFPYKDNRHGLAQGTDWKP
jgi:hypothetical protein